MNPCKMSEDGRNSQAEEEPMPCHLVYGVLQVHLLSRGFYFRHSGLGTAESRIQLGQPR